MTKSIFDRSWTTFMLMNIKGLNMGKYIREKLGFSVAKHIIQSRKVLSNRRISHIFKGKREMSATAYGNMEI